MDVVHLNQKQLAARWCVSEAISSHSALTPMLAAGLGSTEVEPPVSGCRSSAALTPTAAGNAGRPDGVSPAMAWMRAVAP